MHQVPALSATGKSTRKIAEELGLERGQVRRALRPVNGHEPPTPPGRLDHAERAALRRRTKDFEDMALRLNLGMARCRTLLVSKI